MSVGGLPPTHRTVLRLRFKGESIIFCPRQCTSPGVRDSWRVGGFTGWLASLTLEDGVRLDLDLPRVVCEYEDVFPDELLGMPSQRVVDFGIELHLGTLPISMTPHRMAPVELKELRVQLQELLDKGFIRPSTYLCYSLAKSHVNGWGCSEDWISRVFGLKSFEPSGENPHCCGCEQCQPRVSLFT